MKKRTILVICTLAISACCFAQVEEHVNQAELSLFEQKGTSSYGLGLGLPYGGLVGINITHNVLNQTEIFGSVGYIPSGLGFNLGLNYTFATTEHFGFYAGGMFGMNGATSVYGDPSKNKTFLGLSLGTGVKVKFNETQYIRTGLILPIKSQCYKDAENELRNDPFVRNYKPNRLVFVTLGYHISF